MATTILSDLINPQVMADMISAKIAKKLVVAPFAKVDTTLQGIPGNQITVPQYAYIGDAEDIAEGVAVGTVKLTTSTTTATVKKAMKAVELTDEAVLSGYGNPIGETNNQLAKAIASKVDNDAMDALLGAQLTYANATLAQISYSEIVDAVDKFDEETNSDKVIFVNPKQVTKLRKDSDFISADKYQGGIMMTGEIGKVANCRVVPSKKVALIKYEVSTSGTSGAKKVVADTASPSSSEIKAGDVAGCTWDAMNKKIINPAVDSYVVAAANTYYLCPIVKLNNDAETEEDAAALTVYLKRDTNVETDRVSLSRKTDISVDKHYTVALSNTAKVVLAKYKA